MRWMGFLFLEKNVMERPSGESFMVGLTMPVCQLR